jgi:hypothetical protein
MLTLMIFYFQMSDLELLMMKITSFWRFEHQCNFGNVLPLSISNINQTIKVHK